MPLSMANIGDTLNIKKISGKEETKRHLEDIGFVAGTEVTVISKTGGNLIINIKGSRIALGRAMANLITV